MVIVEMVVNGLLLQQKCCFTLVSAALPCCNYQRTKDEWKYLGGELLTLK
jgi:hypothetical protein